MSLFATRPAAQDSQGRLAPPPKDLKPKFDAWLNFRVGKCTHGIEEALQIFK